MNAVLCFLTKRPVGPALPFSSGTWPSLLLWAKVLSSRPPCHPQCVGMAGDGRCDGDAVVSGRPASGAAHWLSPAAGNAYPCKPAGIVNKTIRGKMVVFLFLTK